MSTSPLPRGSYGASGTYGGSYGTPGQYGSGTASVKSMQVGRLSSLSLPDQPQMSNVLQYSPFGECSALCGDGVQERFPVCVSHTYGNPVDLFLVLQCHVQPPASVPALQSVRDGPHAVHNGKEVPADSPEFDKFCGPLGGPPIRILLLRGPARCHVERWAVVRLSKNGQLTRNVSCNTWTGKLLPSLVCEQQLNSAPSGRQRCLKLSCTTSEDCSGHGTCDKATRTCMCQPGFAGPHCGLSLGPCPATQKRTAVPPSASATGAQAASPLCCETGAVDSSGACCASGVVGDNGSCCAVGASLDAAGKCCEGVVDACGVCGGSARTVDFTGACCDGVLDAGGRCCPTPMRLDALGVCGGNSSSGSIIIEASGSSSDATGAMVKELAHEMGVPSSQVATQIRPRQPRPARSLSEPSVSPLPLIHRLL
eukprot:jgi/Botrbrau1/7790/Bobra.0159s0218.1